MRVYAEIEEHNHEVKFRVFYEDKWYAVRFPENLFNQLEHEKGEGIIKKVMMMQ